MNGLRLTDGAGTEAASHTSRGLRVVASLVRVGLVVSSTWKRHWSVIRSAGRRAMRILTAGTIVGFGLGGFVDGIVLHQILQWHNMGSAVLPPETMEAMKQNMLWDGLFHGATWLVTFGGVWMLWREGHRGAPTARVLAGQMLFGWGAFNLIEGLMNHHLLGLHHVRDLPVHVPAYDWAFLALGGVMLLALGGIMARRAPDSPP